MAALLIVAHAPLASALAAVARHPGLHPEAVIEAVDVPPQLQGPDEVCALVRAALLRMGEPQVLVLTDVYAATPCNGTLLAAEGVGVRVVSGVNVPMLWKAVGRIGEPLDDLTAAAVAAGQQGVMPLPAVARRP
jgi:PTS system ascorbate-specific IIA component